MALVTLLDSTGRSIVVYTLRLELPLFGKWTAHLETTEEEPIAGAVTLQLQHGDEAAALFVGTVDDGAPYEGTAPLVVVGGAGGLSRRPAVGAYYTAAPSAVEVVSLAKDIADEAGETLAEELAVDGNRASAWSRSADESHARALTRIAERFGLGWRVLADGKLWVGAETWPDAELDGEELDVDTDARLVRISYRVASARPGTTIAGRRISRVIFTDDGLGELHYEAST